MWRPTALCGLAGLDDRRCRAAGGLGVGLADVDSALEEGAVFDADASRSHVTGQSAFRTNINTIGRGDVPTNLAEDDDLAGSDVGRDLAIATDGDAIAGQVDAAFDLSIDKQRLRAVNLAFDEQAFADGGLFAGGRSGLRTARRFKRGRGRRWNGAGRFRSRGWCGADPV